MSADIGMAHAFVMDHYAGIRHLSKCSGQSVVANGQSGQRVGAALRNLHTTYSIARQLCARRQLGKGFWLQSLSDANRFFSRLPASKTSDQRES
jgi:hypothetical protein